MKSYLRERVSASLRALGVADSISISFEKPRQAGHGDLTTNIAMIVAKKAGRNPREFAGDVIRHLDIDPSLVGTVEAAGPGFINFTFTEKFYHEQLRLLLAEPKSFGRTTAGEGKRTQVEFVSANPTGPLTVGHGRNAVFGDTVANLLEWTGHTVEREYYFNNAGR